MFNRKTIVPLAGLLVLLAAFYISASTAFVVLLLGLLFIPPALMVGGALLQGVSIINETAFDNENEAMVIAT